LLSFVRQETSSLPNCLEYNIIVKWYGCKNVCLRNVNNLWALKCCNQIVCNQLYMNNKWTSLNKWCSFIIYPSKTVNFTVDAVKTVTIWENVLYELYSFLNNNAFFFMKTCFEHRILYFYGIPILKVVLIM